MARTGCRSSAIHNFRPFFTRGILLDVLALKGGDLLPINYVITLARRLRRCARQNIKEPGEGDAVLFRTGQGKLWMKDNAKYNGSPGPGTTVAQWLIEKKVCCRRRRPLAGEAVPGEDKDRPFECHRWLITMNGIHINENVDMEDLGAGPRVRVRLVFSPLRLKGATGSPGNPIAIA